MFVAVVAWCIKRCFTRRQLKNLTLITGILKNNWSIHPNCCIECIVEGLNNSVCFLLMIFMLTYDTLVHIFSCFSKVVLVSCIKLFECQKNIFGVRNTLHNIQYKIQVQSRVNLQIDIVNYDNCPTHNDIKHILFYFNIISAW